MVEAFSGIGAQTEALKRAKIDHCVSNIIEWEVGAMYAYDIIHNGPQNLKLYRHHTKESLISELGKYPISNDGKKIATYSSLSSMSILQIKSILYSIERNRNLVDICSVNSSNLTDHIDLLTYSFPCQDLSVGSFIWKNNKGINKGSGGQSSLLWEIERILIELKTEGRFLPKTLLMENVSAILSKKNIANFTLWTDFLESMGYFNKIYTLNSYNFGIPQNRERTYMISVFVGDDDSLTHRLEQYFNANDLELKRTSLNNRPSIGDFLRLDYSNRNYFEEAEKSTPNFTPSREKIYYENTVLAIDDLPINSEIARTITTKQDRNPNSGIVKYTEKNKLYRKGKYRNITPREAFLLMGFKEKDYDNLIKYNTELNGGKGILSDSKLLKLAGNSIVIDVLVDIFKQLQEIDSKFLKKDNKEFI